MTDYDDALRELEIAFSRVTENASWFLRSPAIRSRFQPRIRARICSTLLPRAGKFLAVATTQAPSSYGAGVRLERQGADERWHLATDGGVKFAGLNTAPPRTRGRPARAPVASPSRRAKTPFTSTCTVPSENCWGFS